MRMIDVSGNKISEKGAHDLIKRGLMANQSLVSLDLRINPGFTESTRKLLSLLTLRNIQHAQRNNVSIQPNWLIPEIYKYQAPYIMLQQLGLVKQSSGDRRSKIGSSRHSA